MTLFDLVCWPLGSFWTLRSPILGSFWALGPTTCLQPSAPHTVKKKPHTALGPTTCLQPSAPHGQKKTQPLSNSNGGSEDLNAFTVARIANPTPTIPVSMGVPRGSESPKATIVTRILTPTPTIPVTVDTTHEDRDPNPHDPCDCRTVDDISRGSKGPKAMTVTRIATPTPTRLLTLYSKRIRRSKSDDSDEDRDPNPHDPGDCWRSLKKSSKTKTTNHKLILHPKENRSNRPCQGMPGGGSP